MTEIIDHSQFPGRLRRVWKTLGPVQACVLYVFLLLVIAAAVLLLVGGRIKHPLFAAIPAFALAYPLMPLVMRLRPATIARTLNIVWMAAILWLVIGRRVVVAPAWTEWAFAPVLGLYVGVYFFFWSDLRLYISSLLHEAEQRGAPDDAKA